MATTTDIAGWLDHNEPADEQDRHDLLNSVRNVDSSGNYCATKKNGKLAVAGWSEDVLLLVSEKAKAALIREIENLKFDDDVGQEFRNIR